MNRRFFVKAIFGILGLLGLGKTAEAKENPTHKYKKMIRKCDEATLDEFRYLKCIKEDGSSNSVTVIYEFRDFEKDASSTVPIMWASDENVNSYLLSKCPIGHTSNPEFEKLETDKHMESLRDRTVKLETPIYLPLMNLFSSDIVLTDKIGIIYNLSIRTHYKEDMNQILEQIIMKFHPTFTNSVGTYTLIQIINNDSKTDCINRYEIKFRVDLK